jgi:hypothetical protein
MYQLSAEISTFLPSSTGKMGALGHFDTKGHAFLSPLLYRQIMGTNTTPSCSNATTQIYLTTFKKERAQDELSWALSFFVIAKQKVPTESRPFETINTLTYHRVLIFIDKC